MTARLLKIFSNGPGLLKAGENETEHGEEGQRTLQTRSNKHPGYDTKFISKLI